MSIILIHTNCDSHHVYLKCNFILCKRRINLYLKMRQVITLEDVLRILSVHASLSVITANLYKACQIIEKSKEDRSYFIQFKDFLVHGWGFKAYLLISSHFRNRLFFKIRSATSNNKLVALCRQ
jgi:hypothetical protein